tara:strand:+ start:8989 stop:10170 length:1182 start_codon:yes stop_codon:yes gene_type:complete
MSNLLKEAIVDAKALREAALKNAETTIIDKYSNEVRDTLEKLLEQDEPIMPEEGGDLGDPLGDMDLAPEGADMGLEAPLEDQEEIIEDLPLAATDGFNKHDGEGLSRAAKEGERLEVDIELDALQEIVKSLQVQMDESEKFELNEEDILDLLSNDDDDEIFVSQEDAPTGSDEEPAEGETAGIVAGEAAAKTADAEQMKGLDEDVEIPDDLLNAIMEKLTVDMGADLAGWAGRSSEDMKYEMEKELAHRRSTDVEEEIKVLKKAQEELVFENKQLKERLLQYKQATQELKEGLQDVNLSNARLLYTNRVLRNASLNERQKERIVEAISSAGSVTEARTIFDTLQSTVEAKPKKSPQSLNEAITNRSSVIRASRQESTSSDPFQERMKRLAGIK